MVWMLYAILAVTVLALVLAAVMVAKRTAAKGNTNAQRYDVFSVQSNQLVVLAGIPVSYELEAIERVTFSVRKAPKSTSSYNGIMTVIKAGGKKSRPFLFDSSAYKKKFVLSSSKQDIEQTVQYLMDELRQHHISCSRAL